VLQKRGLTNIVKYMSVAQKKAFGGEEWSGHDVLAGIAKLE
jgi:hypothetical protein